MSSPRLARGCLAAVLLVAVLALLGTVLVRRALNLAILRPTAEARLSAALGQPVSIGRMDVSLWPRPVVESRDIRVGAGGGESAPSLALGALRIVPRVLSLFSKPVVVDRVEVEGLTLTARRDAKGRWLLPLPGGRTGSSGDAGASVNIGRVWLRDGSLVVVDDLDRSAPASGAMPGRAQALLTHVEASLRLQGGVVFLDSMNARVGGSTIAGAGSASGRGLTLALEWKSLTPADLPQVFSLLGVPPLDTLSVAGDRPLTLHLTVDQGGVLSGSGRLAASRVSLGTLGLESLVSPVRLAGNRLALDPLTFSLYSGRQRGMLRVDLGASPIAWFFRSEVEEVDVNRLLSANTSARNKVSGVGRMRADLRGTADPPVDRTLVGTIDADVANGVIHDFPLLASLNAALHLGTSGDDRDFRFETLSAVLHVAGGRASADEIVARSGDLTVRAGGTVGFDQSLDLTGTASFTRERSDDLVRRSKDLGGLRNARGEIEVPFSVTGTAASPSFGIDAEKILMRAAGKELKRQLNRQLRKFIRIR